MRVRLLVTVSTALLLLAPTAPTASGFSAATTSATLLARTQLLLNFDNGETLRPGTLVRNVAGRANGRVLVARSGRLRVAQGLTGRGALFPRECSRCGRAIIEVPDGRRLDPGRSTLSFGAAVRMTPREGSHRSNIVQKGYFQQAGGQYKLQIDFGRPSCVVRGKAGRLIARAAVNVADRRWHTVSCQRRLRSIVLRVDGRIRARVKGATGWIANEAPVRIGGNKVASGPNEQYHGSIDRVFVRTGR